MKIYLVIISIGLLINSGFSQSEYQTDLLNLEYEIWQNQNLSEDSLSMLIYKKFLHQKHNKDYHGALESLNRLNDNDTILYQKGLMCYLSDDLQLSFYYLNLIDSTSRRAKNKIQLLYLLNLIEGDELEVCYNEIKASFSLNDYDTMPAMVPFQRSAVKAVNRSRIIPGLGLMFEGNKMRGVRSFLISTITLTYAGFQIYSGYYTFATIFGVYPFSLFYKGNRQLTYNRIVIYNEQQKLKLRNEWKEFIFSICKPN